MKITEILDFNPKRPLKKNGLAPFIEMAALPTGARDVEEIGEREVSGSGAKFRDGDVLFARITPCLENGKTAQVSGLGEGIHAHGSTEFIVMSAKDVDSDKDFVYYIARLPEFRSYAKSRMEGTSGRQRVSWQALADFEYDFPDKKERKKIGKILTGFDNKIALNRQINQTLEGMIQALFKSWFVDFEPVRAKIAALETGEDPTLAAMRNISGKTDDELTHWQTADPDAYNQLCSAASLFPEALIESELGLVPEGWEVKEMVEIADLLKDSVNPANNPNKEYWHYSLPAFDEGMNPRIESGNQILSNKFLVHSNVLLFSKLNPRFPRIWPILDSCQNSICSTEFLVIKPVEYCYSFVYSHLNSNSFCEYITGLASGTSNSHQRVKPGDVMRFKLISPNKTLMTFYNIMTIHFIEKIVKNIAKNRTLANIRDTLLPKLLAGEIELSNSK